MNKKAFPELENALMELVVKMDNILTTYEFKGEPIKMYLAGGMAVNYWCATRYTEDVDASFSRRVLFSDEEMQVSYVDKEGLQKTLYLDKNYNTSFALLHEDFEDDSLPWLLPPRLTKNIEIRLLSPLDLAVSKIGRFAERDQEDILALAAEKHFTAFDLRERSNQALSYYVGNLASVSNSINIICNRIEAVCSIADSGQKHAPLDCVSDGFFSGPVIEVAGGVVVQRVTRDGSTVRHDSSKLSAVLKDGDVVDVRYKGGVGVVSGLEVGGKEISKGVGR